MAKRLIFQSLTRQYSSFLSSSIQSLKTLNPLLQTLAPIDQIRTSPPKFDLFSTNLAPNYHTKFVPTRHFSSNRRDDSEDDEVSPSNLKRVYTLEEKENETTAIGYKVIGQFQQSDRVFKDCEPVFDFTQIGPHQFKVRNGDCIYAERLKFCEVHDKVVKKNSAFGSLGSCRVLGPAFSTVRAFSTGPTKRASRASKKLKKQWSKQTISSKKLKKQWKKQTDHLQRITKNTKIMFDLRFTTWGHPSHWTRRRSIRIHGYWIGKVVMVKRRGVRTQRLVHIRTAAPKSIKDTRYTPIVQARKDDMILMDEREIKLLNKYWTDNRSKVEDFQIKQYMKHACLIKDKPIVGYGLGAVSAAKKFLPGGDLYLMSYLNTICKKGRSYETLWLSDMLNARTGYRPFLSFKTDGNIVYLYDIGFTHLGVEDPILFDHPSFPEIPPGKFTYR